MKISALILARNEIEMISDCIKQLDFADEIIVLDQGSIDGSQEEAAKLGAKVLKNFTGQFDSDRNILLNSAKNEWVLFVDCDERLGEEVIKEIRQIVKGDKKGAYYFPRKNIILGKWLRHGGWWPDYVPRLFDKGSIKKWRGEVHEGPQVVGNKIYCKNPIIHLTARSVSKMLNKSIKWAKIEATLYSNAGSPSVTRLKIIKSMLVEFIRRYLIRMGILDGYIGLIQAIYQSLHVAMVQTYLWEIQNKTEERIKKFK